MDCISLIDKYYSDNQPLRDLLIRHSEQVRDRALLVVDAHPQWVNQHLVDRQFVAEAAMLHDIGIYLCDAPRIWCTGPHRYIEHGYLGAELLRQEGLPKHALVAERHTGSGILMEQIIREEIPVPPRDYCPQSLEEKIICYADKFYSKGHPDCELSVAKVRENIWRYGHDSVLRWNALVDLMEN
ncbi:MAG: HD domain-containing protein [Paludibacteraceae bacterium]|nr:HD domain-containing protein [Paludibacteraceae bacterium]